MATVTYLKNVSDANVKAIVQRIANNFGKNITVHSGDRSTIVKGSNSGSLHLHHRAADLHVQGLSDTQVFDLLKQRQSDIFDSSEAYEVIHHGRYTATGGEHIHIGRYAEGKNGYRRGYVDFKLEGITPGTGGDYRVDHRTTGKGNTAPVPTSSTSGVTVSADVLSPNVGVYKSVGVGGVNQYGDVSLVQTLINKALPRLKEAKINFENFQKLVVDGDCGNFTKNAITIFQRDVLGFTPADGRIDPGGTTIRALYVAAYGDAGKIAHRVKRVTTLTKKPKTTQTGGRENVGEAQRLLNEPRIKAMLGVLALSEGTENTYGRIVFGLVKESPYRPDWVGKSSRRDNRDGVIVTDFSRHPRVLVQTHPGQLPKDWSTAAGRYQFLQGTWAGLNLPNFTPANQDIGCVMLFQRRGMIEPLLNGGFDEAVQRGSLEWASLPDSNKGGASHYGGQPSVPLPRLRAKYQEELTRLGG